MVWPPKILFKYPCRGREKLFFESLDSIYQNLSDVNNFHVNLTLDVDDEILNRPDVIERLSGYKNSSISWGTSKSKVHAINRDMPDVDFDILICWSNDMFATFFGFDDLIRVAVEQAFGEEWDGMLHLPEPDSGSALNVLYIVTDKYYRRFGYIYHPEFKSLWCDNLAFDIAKKLGKYAFNGTPGLYEHRNPAYMKYGIDRDALFDEQQGHWNEDEQLYYEIKNRGYDLHLINQK